MSQAQWILLAFKVVTISGFASLVTWIAQYTTYTAWWRNAVGRTLVIKTSLIALLLVPTILSLFFHFKARGSYVAAWIDVCILGAVTPVMLWRIDVWRKIHKGKGGLGDDAAARRVAELEAENAELRRQIGGKLPGDK